MKEIYQHLLICKCSISPHLVLNVFTLAEFAVYLCNQFWHMQQFWLISEFFTNPVNHNSISPSYFHRKNVIHSSPESLCLQISVEWIILDVSPLSRQERHLCKQKLECVWKWEKFFCYFSLYELVSDRMSLQAVVAAPEQYNLFMLSSMLCNHCLDSGFCKFSWKL